MLLTFGGGRGSDNEGSVGCASWDSYTFGNPRVMASALRFPHVPPVAPNRGRFVRGRQFPGDSGGAGKPSEGAQVLHSGGAGGMVLPPRGFRGDAGFRAPLDPGDGR